MSAVREAREEAGVIGKLFLHLLLLLLLLRGSSSSLSPSLSLKASLVDSLVCSRTLREDTERGSLSCELFIFSSFLFQSIVSLVISMPGMWRGWNLRRSGRRVCAGENGFQSGDVEDNDGENIDGEDRVAKCQFFYKDHFCPTKFTPRKSA